MVYVVLEFFWNVWFVGMLASLLHMVSVFAFGPHDWRWRTLFATLWFSLIWPLAVLSPEGRKHLLAEGVGKVTAVYVGEGAAPDLMVKMADLVTADLDKIVEFLKRR